MTSLLHAEATLGTQTLRTLRRFPDRVAFAWDGGAMTGAATVDLIGRTQKVLMTCGAKPRCRIALLSPNSVESWCASVAAHLSAMSITWLHPLGSLDDQVDQLTDFEADILIVDASAFGARGGELASRVPALSNVFTIGKADYGKDLMRAAETVGTATARDTAALDDLAVISYTGGTTGKSKGALRRHREYAPFAAAVLADFEFPLIPRYLAVAPISHVAGTKVLPVLMQGGSIYLHKRFDPEAILATIARERINFTLLVPTMIYVLLDHPKLSQTDLSSLELLLYGASPMSPSRLLEGLGRIGPVFSQLYGQTECYPICVLRKSDHDAKRTELFESCGFPVASCDVRVLDSEDQELPVGGVGEICVRAPQAMLEYWKRPDQTAETLKNNWLHTGDIARADDRGYLFILDRKKDMIISGGFNIYPREVEDVLSAHKDVAMVAVIGTPDPKWGEAVTAIVVPRPGTKPNSEELTALVKDRKGHAYAPKRIELVESLPMTPIGKVDKKALRAPYWAGQTRSVG